MAENCLNCNESITGNFCSNCGQKKYKRIDKKYIWDELQYTVFHTNKGLLYSLKNIIKNPGKTAKDYINGNRVNHYKPILLTFLLSGFSTFISFKLLHINDIMKEALTNSGMYSDAMSSYMTFISSYNSFLTLILIPFFAILTYLAFKKWGNNYYEHVVMNSYILSFYTIFSIVVIYPIYYLAKDNHQLFLSITMYANFIMPFILVWFFKSFYSNSKLKDIILRVLFIIGMLFIAYIVLCILVAIIFLIVSGPEGLKHLQPKKI